MRGVKSDDLLAIVDFLYRGEANVYQENLDSFLAIAEELQLKGLMGKSDENVMADFLGDGKYQASEAMQVFEDKLVNNPKNILPSSQAIVNINSTTELGRTVTVSDQFSGDIDELEERVMSMIEKSENRLENQRHRREYVCKVCGKQGEIQQIKEHIEANHLKGISIPCNHCDKYFSSRASLRNHIARTK